MSAPVLRLATLEDLDQLVELRVLMQTAEWRGRGLAGALMKLLIEHARCSGVDKLHLGATEAGKGVYERVGFRAPRFVPLELRL